MVGIDVVHMNWSSRWRGSPAYQHRGYLSRISSGSERKWVLGAVRPDEALWQLWAAKEAAYKALSPADGKTAFRPAEISIRWRSRGPAHCGEARWGAARSHVIARTEEPCTYAVAIRTDKRPPVIEHGLFPIREILTLPENRDIRPTEQSDAGKRVAVYLLELIGIGNAVIARSDGGRPYVAGRPDVSVCWSHDGEWVAAIAAVQEGMA
jgi:phosphopantetheinyl transferase (holo-ACP synthase)